MAPYSLPRVFQHLDSVCRPDNPLAGILVSANYNLRLNLKIIISLVVHDSGLAEASLGVLLLTPQNVAPNGFSLLSANE